MSSAFRIISCIVLLRLKTSWRVVLPNLEQCALLSIEYADMDEIAAAEDFWKRPLLGDLNPSDQQSLLYHSGFLRLEYAIHSENYLTQSRIKRTKQFREKAVRHGPSTVTKSFASLTIFAMNRLTGPLAYTRKHGTFERLEIYHNTSANVASIST
jgi:hypothetical protein